MPLRREERIYTYADYLSWPEDERLEIIDGVVYAQATPSSAHQTISGNLFLAIGTYLKGKSCKVFAAPFTVRLPMDGDEVDEKNNRNIVEPDLVVVCDKSKLDKGGYQGAPTLVIEIVSKSSAKRDHIIKLNKYQQAKVKEYWIITPETETIVSYNLGAHGCYDTPDMYILGVDEEIIAKSLPELSITLKDVFAMWE